MIYSVYFKFIMNRAVHLMKTLIGVESTKMVIIVREDLKMGRGKIASQVAHAAVSLYQSGIENSNPHLKSWMLLGQPKIILKINCEEKVQYIVSRAKEYKLNVCVVRDAGRTQVEPGTITVVGIGPNKVNEIDDLTGDLKLL